MGRRLLHLCSPPLLTIAVILAVSSVSFAQTDTAQKPVTWEFSSRPGPQGRAVIVLQAHIADGWKLYSTTMPDSLVNSRVKLDSGAQTAITGIDETGRLQTVTDTILQATTRYFTGDVRWIVHLRPVEGKSPADLKGTIAYMAEFGKDSIVTFEQPFRYGYALDGNLVAKSTGLRSSAGRLRLTGIDLANPVHKCGGTGTENSRSKGMLSIFVLGFLGGLLGLIMPCTFPMIPLTVGFFTKQAGSRSKGVANAFLYGFFIFLIYVLISVPFYFLKANNANILNTISTNVWLNIGFAVIFLVFALSFFGLFEITLPSSISNSVDSRSDMRSLGGIFFMALTLAIVSFSCTGPILGSLLVGALSQTGGAAQLTVAMAGFGLALGLPFALFALFPNWLATLPRSGNWMNTVKKVFAFIELALMLKFLSNADLVTHWGLLKRETFFGLWIAIGLALVLYLFGILKFHHDPPPERLSKARIVIGLLFLAFVIYLSPGLTNTRFANRSLVSGFPPPLSYSLYSTGPTRGVEADVVNDYDKALQLARQEHKPILIDFTGWACVNCRKMEENVWPQQEVKGLIKGDYILVSLYVDDRKQLPDDQQFLFTTGDGSKKEIRTVGDKFATLQSENFGNASQPFYVLISPDERLLTYPVGYTPDARTYAQWLQCGLDAFKGLSHSTTKN
ncbi:MAG TPA: cytochrome c biogenesis protein CcdA [Puia sp.]|nr:cytochrome c biogenesis protein CcdA [Puia sp.]